MACFLLLVGGLGVACRGGGGCDAPRISDPRRSASGVCCPLSRGRCPISLVARLGVSGGARRCGLRWESPALGGLGLCSGCVHRLECVCPAPFHGVAQWGFPGHTFAVLMPSPCTFPAVSPRHLASRGPRSE